MARRLLSQPQLHEIWRAKVAKLPMSVVLRTQTTGETKGFMKALVAAHDDRRFAGQQCVPRSSAAS